MRVFIAIPVEPEAREQLAVLQERLLDALPRGSVRPEKPDNFHITLKFLGDVEAEEIERIGEAARRAAAGVPAEKISVNRLGAFPSIRRPRVFWAGFAPGVHGSSEHLAGNLSQHLDQAGYRLEKRKFSPHITLARVKSRLPAGAGRVASDIRPPEDLDIYVNKIVVFESILTPEGAVHKKLVTFRIAD